MILNAAITKATKIWLEVDILKGPTLTFQLRKENVRKEMKRYCKKNVNEILSDPELANLRFTFNGNHELTIHLRTPQL